MSEIVHDVEMPEPGLLPYLKPEYWDGHMLGDGDAIDASHDVGFSHKQARRAISDQFHSAAILTTETYRDGQVFNPDEYKPGAVVMYVSERLSGPAEPPRVDPQLLAATPLMDRPVSTSPSYGSEVPGLSIVEGPYRYRQNLRWGVVVTDKKTGTHVVAHTPASLVINSDKGLQAIMPFIGRRFDAAIGATGHETGRPGYELLDRTNILHVLKYGIAERKRQFKLAELLAGRWALGEA
jgi:hypothetical protein